MAYSRLEDLREAIYGSSVAQRNTRKSVLTALVMYRWRQESSKRLNTTLGAYLASISEDKNTPDNIISVSLPENPKGHLAFLASMVEFGYGGRGIGSYGGPYDMRTHGQILNNIRPTKTAFGMQRVVAFKMGKASAASRVTSRDIDKAFYISAGNRKPIATTRISQGKTSWGTSLDPSLSTKLKPHHAATAAARMVFSTAKNSNSAGSGVNTYTIFRSVGYDKQTGKRKQGDMSWISKGVAPRDIARRYVVPALPDILKEAGVI